MRSIKIFFAIFIMSIISLACEPDELPQDQPQMDNTNLPETASGNQENPIDDDRMGDD